MSIPKFDFTKHWTNPADFPAIETDEAQVRADMQALHDETRDYFNERLLPHIEQELSDAMAWTEQAVKDAVLGEVPAASVTGEKLAPGAVGTENLADGAVTGEKLAAGATLPSPGALTVGTQRYDGAEDVALSADGLPIDSASAAALGLGDGATMNEALATLAPMLGAVQVHGGSYVGSGSVGSGSPTALHFPFVPKLVLIAEPGNAPSFRESTGSGAVWFEGVNALRHFANSGSNYILWTNFAVDGTSLKLWGSETHTGDTVPTPTAASQYNAAGTAYVYLGFGVKEGA